MLVAAKLFDIFLHPLERHFLVEQTKVIICGGKVARDGEAEDIDAVVEADDNDILIFGKRCTIVGRKRARAELE